MRWSHVFWDWNGTIIDDLFYNYSIVNTLLKEHHILPISVEEYKSKFCFPIKSFYSDIGFNCDDSEYASIARKYQEIYESKMDELSVSEGVLNLMRFLHRSGVRQFIFSSCDKRTLQLQLGFYPEIDPYIDTIICQDNNLGNGKYSLALEWGKEHKFSNWSSVVIIGDTYYENEIANKLGCSCILVNSGHQLIDKNEYELVFDNIRHLERSKNLFL